MKKALPAVLVLMVGFVALAGPKVLVVDQTTDIPSSLKVGVLARILRTSPLGVEITGTTELPDGPLPQGPFDLVLLVPASKPWVWVVPPALPKDLPPTLSALVSLVDQAVGQVFGGGREARGPGEDLYPLLLACYLEHLGVLRGVRG